MKFDPAKAWPYPVLHPRAYGDDYPRAEFEVEIAVNRTQGTRNVEVTANFELSDPDLLGLVEKGAARYVLLIRATKTRFRELLESEKPRIDERFSGGELSGRVEVVPLLVCTRRLTNFKASGWHSDFAERTFDIETGSVLAEDSPKEYWIDTMDESSIGSIFEHVESKDVNDGLWECRLEGDRVKIAMSISDSRRYKVARERANGQPDGQYLMNGLYLVALIHVLSMADQQNDEYSEYRWFASLDKRLEDVGCQPLGSESADRVVDAQKLLDLPFAKMPIIADAET